MMESNTFSSQIGRITFRVQSQTDPDKIYTVTSTDDGLRCECADHRFRKSDCKHIKITLEKLKQNKGYANNEFRIMERSKLRLCKFCDSGRLKKSGMRKTKSGAVQRYACLDCKKRFTMNFGFEGMRYDDIMITRALAMYYRGMSVRDIADSFEREGIEVSHVAVYGWIVKYSRMTAEYLNGIVPRTGNRPMVRADEVWIKVAGKQKYLFASMDDFTRYWIAMEMADTKFQHDADNLLRMTKTQIGRNPAHFVTDGLAAYKKSARRVFGRNTNHMADIGMRSKRRNRLGQETGANYHPTNNKMERLNGEIRDREKVFRGLKKMDTPIIDGMRVHYNFDKKHGSLGDRTPAELALIKVDGKNKWKTIIQNASLNRIRE